MKQKAQYLIGSVITFLCLSTFLCTSAYAQDQQVKVTPAEFRIEANPPADIRAPFIIENQSDTPITYTIGYKLFSRANSQNGSVVFLNNTEVPSEQDQKIFTKMQVVDQDNISLDSIQLGPKQSKRLQLRITLPSEEPIGDYYFSLLFLPQSVTDQTTSNGTNSNQSSSSTLQAGIGINVLLALGQKTAPQGLIDTFSTPWFRQSGPVPFDLKVTNTGIHYNTPSGEIVIKNIFGQAVGKITIPPTVILAGTTRNLFGTSKSSSQTNQDDSIALSQTIWQENFLLGLYSANLTLSMSEQGPVYSRTIHFVAVPLLALLIFSAFLIILLLSYGRIKKQLKNRF